MTKDTQSSSETTKPLPELFVFYRDGVPFHYHEDRQVFENWMANSAWLYPRDRHEIVRYVPDAAQRETHCDACGKAFEPNDDVVLMGERGNYHQSCYLKRHAQSASACPWCGFSDGHHPWCRSPSQPVSVAQTAETHEANAAELTDGHLALDRLGSPREEENGIELAICERINALGISGPAYTAPQPLSEEERHAVEHARYLASQASMVTPDCCFDYDLVKVLVRALDRAYPLTSTQGDTTGEPTDALGQTASEVYSSEFAPPTLREALEGLLKDIDESHSLGMPVLLRRDTIAVARAALAVSSTDREG